VVEGALNHKVIAFMSHTHIDPDCLFTRPYRSVATAPSERCPPEIRFAGAQPKRRDGGR
jgi:hypothetical protein